MKRIIGFIKKLWARFRRTDVTYYDVKDFIPYEAEMTEEDEEYWRLENVVARLMADDDIDDDWG